jgi:hypothetical protein
MASEDPTCVSEVSEPRWPPPIEGHKYSMRIGDLVVSTVEESRIMRVIAHSRYEAHGSGDILPTIILQHPEGLQEFEDVDDNVHHGWETSVTYKTKEEIIRAERCRKIAREDKQKVIDSKREIFIQQLPSMSECLEMGITPRKYTDFVRYNEGKYMFKRHVIDDFLEDKRESAIMWSHLKYQNTINKIFFHPESGRLIFCVLHRP